MKLPRDLSADDLIRRASKGSHIRLTTQQHGEHHITIPNHDPIRVGTLNNILRGIAEHFGVAKETIARELAGEGRS